MTPTNQHSLPPIIRMTSSTNFRVSEEEIALFHRELRSFVPPEPFDFHAHLYKVEHLARDIELASEAREELLGADGGAVTYQTFLQAQQSWMGDRAPLNGLFFAFPYPKTLDMRAANKFVYEQVKDNESSRGLLMVHPNDDLEAIEAQVLEEGWSGFKVYHVFSARPDTVNAFIGEFLPVWAWELANRHGLCIMLHMMRKRSLADSDNQEYIRTYCRKYPDAKLILAHAGRGFCAGHTVEGIGHVAGLPNLYFDTSAICEAAAFEAVLETYGPERLLYGSDFPVSETRGRCISLGDGFHWLYEWDQEVWPSANPVLIGIESLLALRRACQTRKLSDSAVEKILKGNALDLLGLPAR